MNWYSCATRTLYWKILFCFVSLKDYNEFSFFLILEWCMRQKSSMSVAETEAITHETPQTGLIASTLIYRKRGETE